MDVRIVIITLCVLAHKSGTKAQSTNSDNQQQVVNSENYVPGVFLSVDALKDLQARAKQNDNQQNDQPLRISQNLPNQESRYGDTGITANSANANYNPGLGNQPVGTVNTRNLPGQLQQQYIPNNINPGQPTLIATNGQFGQPALITVNPQPNFGNNLNPSILGNPINLGNPALISSNGVNYVQPNLISNTGQPINLATGQNPVYTVVPVNNNGIPNQGLNNGANTFLVPIQQLPQHQVFALNSGK